MQACIHTAFSYFHCSIKKKVKGPGGGQGVGGPGGGVGPPTHHPQQQQQQHGGGGAGSNKTLPSGGIGMQQQMQPHQSTANHHGNKVDNFRQLYAANQRNAFISAIGFRRFLIFPCSTELRLSWAKCVFRNYLVSPSMLI